MGDQEQQESAGYTLTKFWWYSKAGLEYICGIHWNKGHVWGGKNGRNGCHIERSSLFCHKWWQLHLPTKKIPIHFSPEKRRKGEPLFHNFLWECKVARPILVYLRPPPGVPKQISWHANRHLQLFRYTWVFQKWRCNSKELAMTSWSDDTIRPQLGVPDTTICPGWWP